MIVSLSHFFRLADLVNWQDSSKPKLRVFVRSTDSVEAPIFTYFAFGEACSKLSLEAMTLLSFLGIRSPSLAGSFCTLRPEELISASLNTWVPKRWKSIDAGA